MISLYRNLKFTWNEISPSIPWLSSLGPGSGNSFESQWLWSLLMSYFFFFFFNSLKFFLLCFVSSSILSGPLFTLDFFFYCLGYYLIEVINFKIPLRMPQEFRISEFPPNLLFIRIFSLCSPVSSQAKFISPRMRRALSRPTVRVEWLFLAQDLSFWQLPLFSFLAIGGLHKIGFC